VGGSIWAIDFIALFYDKVTSAAGVHLAASVTIS